MPDVPVDGQITLEVLPSRVAAIGIDRPKKRNGFTPAMLDALASRFSQAEDDPEVLVILLYATGDHFTAGLDLTRMVEGGRMGAPLFPADEVDPVGLFGRTRSKPVVVAIEGFCLTLGIELTLASDIAVAGASSRFGQVEVQRGVMAYAGATLRMVERFGWGHAMRYLLTGDMFDAATALRLGLVQELAPDGQAYATAMQIAERIARASPLAVRATLSNARLAIEQGWTSAVEDLLPKARRLAVSADAAEGEAAFRERRDPVFPGR